MNRIPHVTLIAFACIMFSAQDSAQGQGREVTPRGNAGQMRSPNGMAPDEGSDRRLQLWKSCADLIHPDGGYSISDLLAMFERPRDIRQFLQNLKLAWERGLLLRPSFYDEATLLKFLNGTKVSWNGPDSFVKNPHTELIAGSVASDAFPGTVIKFASNCSIVEYKAANGATLSKVVGNGFLNVQIGSVPEMTLQAVRSVFGQEAGQSIDRGVDAHGNTYGTTEKGSVVYTSVPADGTASTRTEVTFYLRLDTPQQGSGRLAGALVDDDRVTRISMHEVQDHTVGNR